MRISHLALAALAVMTATLPARAQRLDAGTRVRVTAPLARGESRYVGTVMTSDEGRVLLRLDPALHGGRDTLSIPRSLIRRVEVSTGPSTGRSRAEAARTGAIAGLAAGIAVGLLAGTGSSRDGSPKNPWVTTAWVAPAMGAAGAGAGALVGRGSHEQWRILAPGGVALGKRVTVSIRLGF